jgi:hypothetical protein
MERKFIIQMTHGLGVGKYFLGRDQGTTWDLTKAFTYSEAEAMEIEACQLRRGLPIVLIPVSENSPWKWVASLTG